MIIAVSEQEASLLIEKEPRLQGVIEQSGLLSRGRQGYDFFSDLLSSIVSQQLSIRVAEVIWGRFKELFSVLTPAAVLSAENDYIRSAGLSRRKVEYIKCAAEAVDSGALLIASFPDMEDEEVIAELVKLRGIGRWTAEMLLIFTLNRRNVLSIGDLGIRKALQCLYGDKPDFREIFQRFSPCCTALSLYLWELAGNIKGYFPE